MKNISVEHRLILYFVWKLALFFYGLPYKNQFTSNINSSYLTINKVNKIGINKIS